jgi:hypothetical protein
MSGQGTDASAINVTPGLARQLEGASHAEILQALHDAAEQQGLVERDPYSGQLLATPLASNAPRVFTKEITVNQRTYTLEASSPEELSATEVQFWREITAAPQEQPFRGSQRVSIPEDPVVSQQVENYLRNRGIDPEYLNEAAGRGYIRSWSQASDEFKARHPEWQQYASEANMNAIGDQLISMGLDDAPSVEALERAYAELQRNGGLTESPETAYAREIASAETLEDIRALSYAAAGLPPSSGFFNGR